MYTHISIYVQIYVEKIVFKRANTSLCLYLLHKSKTEFVQF